ncbi:MAG: hypothetical protein BWY21_01442 [Parcubacteria group bacterium ADurb.Bin216]|jgi:hypothetical protein|nr:MAG: hypothetical protein BWY21_01442 [Parcubacteria group bacterium ADurb.Bin216]
MIYTPQILIYCEGMTDKYFVNAIKSAYGNDRRFSVRQGVGGSPINILSKCINVPGEFKKYCVIDGVPELPVKAIELAREHNIVIVEVIPYLECVILNYLLDTDQYLSGEDKNNAKNDILSLRGRMGYEDLESMFISEVTTKKLREKAIRLGNFSLLIDIFEKYKNCYNDN